MTQDEDKSKLDKDETRTDGGKKIQEELLHKRHSERIENQGMGAINITEKAEALKEKRNLPGTSQSPTPTPKIPSQSLVMIV